MSEPSKSIITVLKSLGGFESDKASVSVKINNRSVNIRCSNEKALHFKFAWSDNHFIGYFVDSEDKESQAVLSLWTPLDAIQFATAYSLLVQLRAARRGH